MIEAPLSSHLLVPLTPETREALRAKGVAEEAIQGLTEQGGLALLTLADVNLQDAPDCFGHYGDVGQYCTSCVFEAQCQRAEEYIPPPPTKKVIPPPPVKKLKK